MNKDAQRVAICRACHWIASPPLSTLCGWTHQDGTRMLSDPLDAATKWNWRTIWQRLRRDLRHDPALAYMLYLPMMGIYYGIMVHVWWESRHLRRAIKQAESLIAACDKDLKWTAHGATVSDE